LIEILGKPQPAHRLIQFLAQFAGRRAAGRRARLVDRLMGGLFSSRVRFLRGGL